MRGDNYNQLHRDHATAYGRNVPTGPRPNNAPTAQPAPIASHLPPNPFNMLGPSRNPMPPPRESHPDGPLARARLGGLVPQFMPGDTTKLRSAIAKAGDMDNFRDIVRHEVVEGNKDKDRENPLSKKQRLGIWRRWTDWVMISYPDLNPDLYWTIDTVRTFCRPFLRLLVRCTPGCFGNKYIKAITLRGFQTALLRLILQNTWDPVKQEKAGIRLLVDEGMFKALEEETGEHERPLRAPIVWHVADTQNSCSGRYLQAGQEKK